jgi:Zn-finger nucleic acid-binding protein
MILACTGCDGRYDVTGYPVGQQFRCRCGTINTLAAPARQAAELTCPQCGAGVAPNASDCAHCNHHLLVKACPRCLSRVFHGHKHCPECGSELSLAATAETTTERACPRCETMLSPRLVADVVVDECMQCRGLFLDQLAVQRVITDRQQARAEALLGSLPSTVSADRPEKTGKLYIKCPICKVVMNRKLFGAGAGVVIDVCRAHGTFFDVGELPVIITYVQQGGLEKQAKKEIERMREAAKREQLNAAYANARSASSSGEYNMYNGAYGQRADFTRGSLLVDLLSSLFR